MTNGKLQAEAYEVLLGEKRQVTTTHRPEKFETYIMYFEKNQMTLKICFFDWTKKGQRYIKIRSKYVVSMKPMLRIRRFYRDTDTSGVIIHEYSYKTPEVLKHFSIEKIGEEAFNLIELWLNFHGYDGGNDLMYNIVPWDYSIRPYCRFKKAWRNPNIKDVLKDFGLPSSKSFVREALNQFKRIDEDDEEMLRYSNMPPTPNLTFAKFIYDICKDINVTLDVWSKTPKNTANNIFDTGTLPADEDWIAWRAFTRKRWHKSSRVAFCRSFIRYTESWGEWRDLLEMLVKCRKHGLLPRPEGNNVRKLHDQISKIARQIDLVDARKPIKYEDDIKKLNGHKFKFEGKEYTIRLPRNKRVIVNWSVWLSNCMHSYADRTADRRTTLVGIFSGKELVVGIEYLHRATSGQLNTPNRLLSQIKTIRNGRPPIEFRKAIIEQFNVLGLLDNVKDPENDDIVYNRVF